MYRIDECGDMFGVDTRGDAVTEVEDMTMGVSSTLKNARHPLPNFLFRQE